MIKTYIGAGLALAASLLAACKAETPSNPVAPAAAPASAASAAAPSQRGGIVLRARDGGQHPDRFCMPEWSIANETDADVGALLIELEWRTRGGEVLQPVGDFGSLVDAFRAGRRKDLTLNGYSAACSELELVVRKYACRNADAVRMPCPGPLRAETPGTIRIDLAAAVEGAMRGAVEGP